MLIEAAAAGAMIGVVVLITAPPLLEGRDIGPQIGNLYASIAMQTLRTPAISVSPHTELSLRRRAHSRKYHAEKISVGDVARLITKTPGTMGWWGSRPFTLIDEKYGSTFSLRDVLVGYREHQHRQDGEMTYTEYEYDDNERLTGMQTYARAFFEFGERRALPMDLSESIHPITDGAEDATMWNRVREGVKRMFALQQQSVGVMKLALPMLAVVGGFLAGFYLFGPGQLPGAPSTGSTVTVGAAALLLLGAASGGDGEGDDLVARIRDRLEAVERETWIRLGTSVAIVSVVGVALWIAPLATVGVAGGALAVIAGLPLLSSTLVSALPATVAEGVADTWMTLGLKAFADPIVRETDSGEYRIDESDALPRVGATPRYRFCKSRVGFTCDVTTEAFGEAGLSGSDLEEHRGDVRADGGDALPGDVDPTESIKNAGHKGFLPSYTAIDSQRRTHTFVRTDRWLARFADAATGKISEKAQQEAIKEFAGGDPQFTDRQIMLFGLGGLFVGIGLSFVLWGGILF